MNLTISKNSLNVSDLNEPTERQIVSMGQIVESTVRNPLQGERLIIKISAQRAVNCDGFIKTKLEELC